MVPIGMGKHNGVDAPLAAIPEKIADDPFAEAEITFGDNQLCIDLCYTTVVGSTDYEPQQKRWAICQLICEAVLKHLLKDINVA